MEGTQSGGTPKRVDHDVTQPGGPPRTCQTHASLGVRVRVRVRVSVGNQRSASRALSQPGGRDRVMGQK